MAATVELRVLHGASPGLGTNVTGSTLRMKRADSDTQDASNPVPVPDSGYAYSWRKSLKLVATVAPDNQMSNLRVYSDQGSLGTGRAILYARSSSYVQASAADESNPIGGTDVDTFTAASPDTIQAGNFITSADTMPTDGGSLQDIVMVQMRIADNAAAGAPAGAKVITWRWDEL